MPACEILVHVLITSVSREGSDEAVHIHSLARDLLLAYTKYGSRGRIRLKIRPCCIGQDRRFNL